MISRLPVVLRVAEAAALVEAPDAGEDASEVESAVVLRDRAILELMYGSGLRVSEVAGVTVDRVDLDRGRVTVVGKGDKEREVPLGDPARQAVVAWLTVRSVLAPREGDELFMNRGVGRSAHATSDGLWDDTARSAFGPAGDAAHTAALERHAPAGGRSRRRRSRKCSATRAWPRPRGTPT